MAPDAFLPLHDPHSFVPKFFGPAPALQRVLGTVPEQFFIVRVEDMYPHLRGPLPVMAILVAGASGVYFNGGLGL